MGCKLEQVEASERKLEQKLVVVVVGLDKLRPDKPAEEQRKLDKTDLLSLTMLRLDCS